MNSPQYRWDGTERINILLLGTDAHPSRGAVLTDVVLVVSIDPVAETAAMISVPRDTGFLPMPDESLFLGGVFPDKVNELQLHASLDPATWCPDLADDPQACGLRTIERSVGLYLGLQIHHYAMVDMAGFAELIDALGGVRLCLPGELHDPAVRRQPEQLGPRRAPRAAGRLPRVRRARRARLRSQPEGLDRDAGRDAGGSERLQPQRAAAEAAPRAAQ